MALEEERGHPTQQMGKKMVYHETEESFLL